MIRRRLMRLFSILAPLSTGAALLAPVAAHADVSFDVPDAPRGVITVTADVSAANYPFVTVALNQFGTYVAATAAVTPLVATAEGATSIAVETWGLAGRSAFTLLGCTADALETCAPIAATATRDVYQTDYVSPQFSVGNSVVFWPEDTVSVTTGYTGGGLLTVDSTSYATNPTRVQTDTITPGTYVYDLSDLPDGLVSFGIKLCSSYNDHLCTAWVGRSVYLSNGPITLATRRTDGSYPLTTRPGSDGSTAQLVFEGSNRVSVTQDVAWTLEDPSGHTVLGPVSIVSGKELHGPVPFTVDPAARAAALPVARTLPDGTYTLRVSATYTNGRVTRQATTTVPLTLLANPPQEHPRVAAKQRDIRLYGTGGRDGLATWSVSPVSGRSGRYTLTVRDASHRVVWQHKRDACDACDPAAPFDVTWGGEVGTPATWGGATNNLRMAPGGTYSATATLFDRYGRPTDADLGQVRVLNQHIESRRVVVEAGTARISTGRLVGRCSAVRSPRRGKDRGSVLLASGARCDSRRGNADVVDQRFQLKVPSLPRDAVVYVVSARVRLASDNKGRYTPYLRRFAFPDTRLGWSASQGRQMVDDPQWTPPFWWRDAAATMGSYVSGRRLDGSPFLVDLRVANGNRVDVRKLELTVSYWRWTPTPANGYPADPGACCPW